MVQTIRYTIFLHLTQLCEGSAQLSMCQRRSVHSRSTAHLASPLYGRVAGTLIVPITNGKMKEDDGHDHYKYV